VSEIVLSWQVATGLIIAIATMVFAFGRILLSQFDKRMDERHKASQVLRETENETRRKAEKDLRDSLQMEAGRISALRDDLSKFMSQLPLHYVRREDWIRFSATIDSKLDRLADLVMKANIGGNSAQR
jgi:hypothetical protein